MSNSIPEIEDCPFLLCVGTNMTECHPIIAVRVKKALRKGARLFTIDPREFRTMMEGLAYGKSSSATQREEDRFYHNKLKFTFAYPEDWSVDARR